MKFSFCLITKNEEKYIDACLAPLAKTGMPIVVLDTGSTDRTVEIAHKYTNNIFDFTWQNDFALARNTCAQKAATEYVYFIDADEITTFINIKKILQQIKDFPAAVGQMKRISLSCSGDDETCNSIDYPERLYSKKFFHYEGRIHEQVTFIDSHKKNEPLPYYETPLTTRHEGYLGSIEEREKKARRNIDLLLLDLQEHPEDPYIYYQLGLAYRLFNHFEEADSFLSKGVSMVSDYSLRYVTDLILNYGQNLLSLERYADVTALDQYLPHYKENADFLCMLGYAYMSLSKLGEAISLYTKATTVPEASVVGNNSSSPHHNLGCIYEATENYSLARKHFKLAGDYAKSQTRLSNLPQNSTDTPPQFCVVIPYTAPTLDWLGNILEILSHSTFSSDRYILALVGPQAELTSSYEKQHAETTLLIHTDTEVPMEEAVRLVRSYDICMDVIPLFANTILSYDTLRQLYQYKQASEADVCLYYDVTKSGGDLLLSVNSDAERFSLSAAGLFPPQNPNPALFSEKIIKKSPQETAGMNPSFFINALLPNVHTVATIGSTPKDFLLT